MKKYVSTVEAVMKEQGISADSAAPAKSESAQSGTSSDFICNTHTHI
jgi:hypothetical protein